MKLSLVLAVCAGMLAGSPKAALSQITIGNNDLENYFGVGKSWMLYENSGGAKGIYVGVPSTSAAQTWTVPAMTFTDSSRSDNVSLSSCAYSANFPGATYVQKTISGLTGGTREVFRFVRVSNDTLYTLGGAEHLFGTHNGLPVDTSLVDHSSDIMDVLPWKLGQSRISSLDTTEEAGGMTKIEKVIKACDAFGTLNLPRGSFQALRMKSTDINYYYSGSTLVSVDTSYYFEFMTREGQRVEVDGVSENSETVDAGSITITYVVNTPTAVTHRRPTPATFSLGQNYPNPFNPTTSVSFEIPATSHVTLRVYDALGREVRTLVNEVKQPGKYRVRFDAAGLPSGMYLYRLVAGTYSATKKLMLTK